MTLPGVSSSAHRPTSPAPGRVARMLTLALAVVALDWTSKAIALLAGPTLPHYTHPNPLALVVPLVAVAMMLCAPGRLLTLGAALCLGGTVGNVGERLTGLPVIDWIWLPEHGVVIVFNLADVALVLSLLVLVAGGLWEGVACWRPRATA